MQLKIKQRIIGGVVLVAIAAIMIPMFLGGKNTMLQQIAQVKVTVPSLPQTFSTEKLAQEQQSGSHPASKSKARTVSKASKKLHTVVAKKAWIVQLGSFTNITNAKRLVKRLRHKGFAAYYVSRKAHHRRYARVFMGPVLSVKRAIQIQKKLHKFFHLKTKVMRYHV